MQRKDWYTKVKTSKLHFDMPTVKSTASQIVMPENVGKHKFYPFLNFKIKAFRQAKLKEFLMVGKKDGERRSKVDLYKTREINYACYADSYIYSFYNASLSEKYELLLKDANLNSNVIAYRSIKKKYNVGKCNIDFAAEAFGEIRKRESCVSIGLDIEQFFNALSHATLKKP